MSSKKFSWKKLIQAILWVAVFTCTVVLLVAATNNQNGKVCKDVLVNSKGVDGVSYVSKTKILKTISGNRPDLLRGQLIKTFDLQQLEELLENNLWIRNAELFFDNNEVLHIDVTERQPIARIFRTNGQTFYLDDLGEKLPATNEQVARVPVFTSFPVAEIDTRKKDSMLLVQIKEMGIYIFRNNFWMAQVDQINIANYEFELMPKLGSHTIQFGTADKLEQKFNRLFLFYNQVMNKTGWNKYSLLDVRFDKQLVAIRRDSASLFASIGIEQNNYHVNTFVDSTYNSNDSILTTIDDSLLKVKSNKITIPIQPVLKPTDVKPLVQNRNALKNQTANLVVKNKQQQTVSQAKKPVEQGLKKNQRAEKNIVPRKSTSQPDKQIPKATMKKKVDEK